MKTIDVNKTLKSEVIKTTTEVLASGGLVLFPTETVYGAGVDATNPRAVKKLLQYKSRREGKPLSIAVKNREMAQTYVKINNQADNLFKSLLPGPYTVVCHGLGQVAAGVESEFNTLGVRIPDYDLIREVVGTLNKPITATSANASGKPRPYSVEGILKHLSQKQTNLIDLVLDAGELPKNQPSTVIDTTLSTPTIVRGTNNSNIIGDANSINSDATSSINGDAQNNQVVTQVTHSELETRELAGKICLKNWEIIKNRGLVIGLNGVLGAGKTIFAKGVADFLQINELITSPTYNYIEEYPFNRHGVTGKFFHIDTWKVESPEMASRLEIEKLIAPSHVVVIEWFETVADLLIPYIQNNNAAFINIEINENSEHESLGAERVFKIKENL